MNKFYLIVPIVLLGVFCVYYRQFSVQQDIIAAAKAHDAEVAAAAAAQSKKDAMEKAKADQQAREQAQHAEEARQEAEHLQILKTASKNWPIKRQIINRMPTVMQNRRPISRPSLIPCKPPTSSSRANSLTCKNRSNWRKSTGGMLTLRFSAPTTW